MFLLADHCNMSQNPASDNLSLLTQATWCLRCSCTSPYSAECSSSPWPLCCHTP